VGAVFIFQQRTIINIPSIPAQSNDPPADPSLFPTDETVGIRLNLNFSAPGHEFNHSDRFSERKKSLLQYLSNLYCLTGKTG
jgi:hypothetical protein